MYVPVSNLMVLGSELHGTLYMWQRANVKRCDTTERLTKSFPISTGAIDVSLTQRSRMYCSYSGPGEVHRTRGAYNMSVHAAKIFHHVMILTTEYGKVVHKPVNPRRWTGGVAGGR